MSNKTVNKVRLSDLPTMHTDGVNIGLRSDDTLLLQFLSDTPDGLIENVRTIMTKEAAISLLDSLANILGHFPVKAEQNETEPQSLESKTPDAT